MVAKPATSTNARRVSVLFVSLLVRRRTRPPSFSSMNSDQLPSRILLPEGVFNFFRKTTPCKVASEAQIAESTERVT